MIDNYYSDHRVRAQERWYKSLEGMKAIIELNDEEITVPFKYEVCPTCEGRGKHVNPSIDCNGLSREDFDQDPDFMEEYMNGTYDVTCYGCDGQRVIPVMDRERIKPDLLKQLDDDDAEERADFRRMQEAERRMGA